MRNISFSAGLCLGAVYVFAGVCAALTISPSLPAQAQPSSLAFKYQQGRLLAEAEINPLAGRLLGRFLKQEVPSAVTFSATELAGSFVIPQTTARVVDGTILLDASPVKAFLEPYLQQAMERVVQRYSVPETLGIEAIESVLNYRLLGQGWLNSADTERMAFTFEYRDGSDHLAVEGIEPAVLALCRVQECKTQLDGEFDLKLDLARLNETSAQLGIQLPANVKRALRRAQLFGFKEVAFADGNLTSVMQILPAIAPGVAVLPEEPVLEDDTNSPLILEFPDSFELTESPVQDNTITQLSSLPVQARQTDVPFTDIPKGLNQLTHGNFVLSAERITAPWSIVFSVPSRE